MPDLPLLLALPSERARLEADLLGEVLPDRGAPDAAPTPQARTLVIADDDADLRQYVRRCLTVLPLDQPLHLLEATDGREALHLIQTQPVDLVICDVRMPGMDGPTLCRTLAADPQHAHLPVLLISGDAEAVHPTGQPGDFLRKPFNGRRLAAAVQALLDDVP